MKRLIFTALLCAIVMGLPAQALRGGQATAPQLPPSAAPMPSVLRNYTVVDAARLAQPADGDWLMVRRTYNGWGYSPLDQITPANVARLQPVWSFSTGVTNGHDGQSGDRDQREDRRASLALQTTPT